MLLWPILRRGNSEDRGPVCLAGNMRCSHELAAHALAGYQAVPRTCTAHCLEARIGLSVPCVPWLGVATRSALQTGEKPQVALSVPSATVCRAAEWAPELPLCSGRFPGQTGWRLEPARVAATK